MDPLEKLLHSLTERVLSEDLTVTEAVKQAYRSPLVGSHSALVTLIKLASELSVESPQPALILAYLIQAQARRGGDTMFATQCIQFAGKLAATAGEGRVAVKLFRAALRISRRLGSPALQALSHAWLGEVFRTLQEYDLALKHYEAFLQMGHEHVQAGILAAMGEVLRLDNRPEEAVSRYEQALELFRQSGRQLDAANVLYSVGQILATQLMPDEAMDRYQQALQIYRQLGERQAQANVLRDMAEVDRLRSQDDQAWERYREAMELHRQVGDDAGVARALCGMGSLHMLRFEMAEAMGYLKQALTLSLELKDLLCEANARRLIGQILEWKMEQDQALTQYQAALELYQHLSDRRGVATILTGMGRILADGHQYGQAQARFEEALQLYRQVGDRHGEADLLRRLGNTQALEGAPQRAQESFEAAGALFQQVGDGMGEGAAWLSVGASFLTRGEWSTAQGWFEKGLATFRRMSDPTGEARALLRLGTVLSVQGEHKQALSRLQEALALYRQVGDHLGEAQVVREIGNAWNMARDLEQAMAFYRRALRVFRKEKATQVAQIETLYPMGHLLIDQKRFSEAHSVLGRAVRLLEEIRGLQQMERFRRSLSNWGASPYQAFVQACLRLGRTEEAWHWSERARGRLLLDQLDSVPPSPRDERAKAAYAEWRQRVERIQRYEGWLNPDPLLMFGAGPEGVPEAEIQRQLNDLRKEEQAHRQQLLRLLDEGRELVQVSVPRPRQLAAYLKQISLGDPRSSVRRLLLVEYYWLSSNRYSVFLLPLWEEASGRPLPLTVQEVAVAPERVAVLMSSWENALAEAQRGLAGGQGGDDRALRTLTALLDEMGRLFLNPWADRLNTLAPTDLVVVPHRSLHRLPLHAALLGGRTPLLERFNLVYLPNAALARTLARRTRRHRRTKGRLVMGPAYRNDLPSAEAEADRLAELWGQKEPYRFEQMKVQALREHAGRISMLHLATHSRFDPEDALRSYVQFHDERLTLMEWITDPTLRQKGLRLCYLNSCESGRSSSDSADNLQGLIWALVHAGAEAVMASLWPVDSRAARHVAGRFYLHLREGATLMSAYRQAVNHLRQEPAFANPYYWAPFILAGNGFQQDPSAEST